MLPLCTTQPGGPAAYLISSSNPPLPASQLANDMLGKTYRNPRARSRWARGSSHRDKYPISYQRWSDHRYGSVWAYERSVEESSPAPPEQAFLSQVWHTVVLIPVDTDPTAINRTSDVTREGGRIVTRLKTRLQAPCLRSPHNILIANLGPSPPPKTAPSIYRARPHLASGAAFVHTEGISQIIRLHHAWGLGTVE